MLPSFPHSVFFLNGYSLFLKLRKYPLESMSDVDW